MKIRVCALLLQILLNSCSQQLKIKGSCTKENILAECQKKFKRTMKSEKIVISEDDIFFTVSFISLDTNQYKLGGSGYLLISKSDCKVAIAQFYQ
jgi:hypothetical protein